MRKEELYEVANNLLGATSPAEAKADGYPTLLSNVQELLEAGVRRGDEDCPYTAREIANYLWNY